MWRKTFIRFMFVVLIALASLLVVNGARSGKDLQQTGCSEAAGTEGCYKDKQGNSGEFLIWETLSRNVMTNVQY